MVKQLFEDTSSDSEERLRRQLDRWSKLPGHEHLLKFYGGSHVSKSHFVVCEDASYGNLRDFFKDEENGALLWTVFLQAAEGLKVLHDRKVCHGNLKCNSILVGANRTAKLADFGVDSVRALAVGVSDNAEFRWKPKEVLESSSMNGPQLESDIYELGMCMIEAITQRPPFGMYNDASAMDMIMCGVGHPRPFGVSAPTWNFVKLLCDPDNLKRPTIAEVVDGIRGIASATSAEAIETTEPTEAPENIAGTDAIDDRSTAAIGVDTAAAIDITVETCGIWDAPEVETIETTETAVEWVFCSEKPIEPTTGIAAGEPAPCAADGSSSRSRAAPDTPGSISQAAIGPSGAAVPCAGPPCVEWAPVTCPGCAESISQSELWCRRCGQLIVASDENTRRRSLSKLLKSGTKIEAWWKVYEVAVALQELHDQGIIHANLKPSNLCAGRDGRAHLSVFDSSVKVESLVNGSPSSQQKELRWLAPERLSGGLASLASDVYSLGMCIIYIVSGEPPWGAALSDEGIAFQVSNQNAMPPRSDAFSNSEWEIVERMCAYNPAKRMTLADVVQLLTKSVLVGSVDDQRWRLSRSLVAVSDCTPFSSTPFVSRHLGRWKDAVVAVEKVTNIFDGTKRTFQSAASLWYSLRHPTVLQLYGACDDSRANRIFVCEYAESGDLSSYIQGSGMDNGRSKIIWQVLLDVAFAIHYLHSIGVVHGDISLHNILVGKNGHGKLSGFTLSSMVKQERTGISQKQVSDGWRAPHCSCGHRPGFSSDVYWFGKCIVDVFCPSPTENISSEKPKLLERLCCVSYCRATEVKATTTRCDLCQTSQLPDQPEGFSDELWQLVLDMCCADRLVRVTMSEAVERLARLIAIDNAIDNKLEEEELCLGHVERQNVQTAMLARVIRLEEESEGGGLSSDSNTYDSDDDDEYQLCDAAATSKDELMKPEKVTQLESFDRLARDAAMELFKYDLKALLNPSLLRSTAPVRHKGCLRFRPVSPQEKSPLTWSIPRDNVVERKWGQVENGSYAEVCPSMWLGAPVALKKVKKLKTFDLDVSQALQEEANIWFGIRHPNVVSLFRACTRGYLLFVCDFIDGGRLEECKRKKVNEETIWGYLQDAAIGLQGLHLHGIVHADLKCDNILVATDGRAKLIDFGLSCLRTFDGSAPPGALSWKAPECLDGAGPTFESDVFSFGMCIVQALTGAPPWASVNEKAVIQHVLKGGLPKQPACFTPTQWKLVRRMCRFDPQDRLKLDDVVRVLGVFAKRLPYVKDRKLQIWK